MTQQDTSRKLSPTEYLAELRRQAGLLREDAGAPPATPAPASGEATVDVLDRPADTADPPRTEGQSGEVPGGTTFARSSARRDSPRTRNDGDQYDGLRPRGRSCLERPGSRHGDDTCTGTTAENGGESKNTAAPSRPSRSTPAAARRDERLAELIDRIDDLIDAEAADGVFEPRAPQTLAETGLSFPDLEGLILRYLLTRGSAAGREIARQLCLPFGIVEAALAELRQMQLVAHLGAAGIADYEFALTERGRERARQLYQECGYCGPAPVRLADYLKAMAAQSVTRIRVTEADLKRAFADLVISGELLDKLGPAINSGRGLFLFGAPGNGKTSIAERIARAFGSAIWIPRTLYVDGEFIRLFDPGIHEQVDDGAPAGLLEDHAVDRRWVRILRPTVVAGGELTMAELEVTQNPHSRVCEAPLQLKSNCGTLVIDDFGRQRMPVEELLNRWIVPLEKRFDFLNLPSGKKVRVPFDQLIVFSTNLDPSELVDAAFLRRLPYKIPVPAPTREQFVELFRRLAPEMGFRFDAAAVQYLIERHYVQPQRPFRACHPRDLLLQVKTYCVYKGLPRQLTPEAFDIAAENYFSSV